MERVLFLLSFRLFTFFALKKKKKKDPCFHLYTVFSVILKVYMYMSMYKCLCACTYMHTQEYEIINSIDSIFLYCHYSLSASTENIFSCLL